MECVRCGNKDPLYFGIGKRGYYCRKCLRFRKILIEEDDKAYQPIIHSSDYYLQYPLTRKQQCAAQQCLSYLREGKNVLLKAVCGAGKTEICVPIIADFLQRGKRVGFAIARREVVIELANRFKKIFPNSQVISVYGGHHQILYGDIVLCTTHQLFRYPAYFDFLVLDEVDAFPFKGNDTLWNIAHKSCVGQFLYSTATIDKRIHSLVEKGKLYKVELHSRPHGKPMPVPKIHIGPMFWNIIVSLWRINHHPRRVLLFVETKKEAKRLYFFLRHFITCDICTSDHPDKEKSIQSFSQKKIKILICTTVLERGVTFPDIDVFIWAHYRGVFDKSSYIQMSGRAGRNFLNPQGEVHIYTSWWDKGIWECRKEIISANQSLSLL